MSVEEGRQRPPAGYKVYQSEDKEEGAQLLRETPVVRGDELVDAQPGFDQRTNEPIITFRFNNAGARKFGNFTKDHVNRPFAIVLDDKVISAPVIREPILGGSGQISGNFTVETATQLAIQLQIRRAAGQAHHRRGTHRRSVAGRRLHRGRQAGRPHRRHRHHHPHHSGLRHLRSLRLRRPHRPRFADRRPDEPRRVGADAAGHCRPGARHRHGRRRQRADLRAHPRGGPRRQNADRRHRCRLHPRLHHHRRFPADRRSPARW